MRKIITGLFITLLFYLLFKPHIARAVWDSFIKYEKNPLIITKSFSQWSEKGIFQHSIIFDDSKYKMWYASYNGSRFKIAKATSSDAYLWEGATLINLDETNDYHDPFIITTENKKILFFATSKYGSNYTIKRAESNDDISFTNKTTILVPTSGWEYKAVSCPNVYKKNGVYFLFYCGWDDQGWAIGLATSSDGINFNRCLNNPLVDTMGNRIPGGNSSLMEKDGKYYLFFHTWQATGIDVIESDDPLGCTMHWKNRKNVIAKDKIYDQNHIISPSIIKINNLTFLFYTGLAKDNIWKFNLAIEKSFAKPPIVIIPGFMASWNSAAILHNEDVSIFDWKLLPFVKEYTGVANSLNNLGYEENKDYYIFPYDWRKSIEDSSSDLNKYLTQKIWSSSPDTKINIIGHSEGGVLGRIFAQKNTNKIERIISSGSPHQGTAKVYKPLEAGVIERDDTLVWLAQIIIFRVNKGLRLESDRTTLRRVMPILFDFIPTFDFLKDKDGNVIKYDSLSIKNNLLPVYNSTFLEIFPFFNAFYGENSVEDTLFGYIIQPPNKLDQLLGNYADGKPISIYNGYGDNTILSQSAKVDDDPDFQKFPFNHGEIIYKKEVIKKIFDQLQIPYQENQIVEGARTKILPSLIFLIKSPAEISVELNGIQYSESDGLTFIPDAQKGDYVLEVKGKEKGRYTVVIGDVTTQNDFWQTIEGKITQDPPSSQIDTYVIPFDPEASQASTITSTDPLFLFDELIIYLKDLNQPLNNKEITKTINNLTEAKQFASKQNYSRLSSALFNAHRQTFQARNKTNEQTKQKLLYAVAKLENLHSTHLKNYKYDAHQTRLKKSLESNLKIESSLENFLLNQKQKGKDVEKNSLLLLEIKNRLDKVEQDFANLHQTEILLKTVSELIKEVRKI